MKTFLCSIVALLGCGTVLASANFAGNPETPYPPGCTWASAWDAKGQPRPGVARFFNEVIDLFDGRTGERIPVRIEAYRSPCPEPHRSLVWLGLRLADADLRTPFQLELPTVVAETPDRWRRMMNLVTEPGGWGSGSGVDRGRTYLVSEPQGVNGYYTWGDVDRRWLFLLDNAAAESRSEAEPALTASQYNAAFRLVLRYPPYDFLAIDVPATADLLAGVSPRLPLSGRLAGAWVVEGAADQGVQLAVSGQVRAGQDDLPLVIFFSQYTFDTEGRPLWLVGNAEFDPGARKVTIPVLRVIGGEFRGDRPAEREPVGSVTLSSRSCNELRFEWDYGALGLGKGGRSLQRLFSLETAGYECRDYEARVEANR